ncbi:hemerythrin domain-containing protein [Gordonia sp. GONU]|uniref:hemerythrin domain-containing protein n=1 Tax=Gordonia sp. GONU TaxID=2972949 RepID=UPI0021ABF349|nr:hemerythrin domain-containing protein [Gordonia sp. GONU]MCR8897372.1 hemerythrin domain-containing protein [Gordonia sp. GONU]
MSTTTREPADTRSMGIVHSALRRDLRRARVVIGSPPYPEDARRRAIADHITWMMGFLHMHHTGEDKGLWPLVRSRNPDAAALLDDMEADHLRIAPAVDALIEATSAYRRDPQARDTLLDALERLSEVLLPHLEREELEAMPVVAAAISTAEFLDVEHEFFVKPKGFAELGREGHWVVDGLGDEDRELIYGVVPAVPRFILIHGFARAYRRRAELMWGHGPASRIGPVTVDAKNPS